VQQTVGAPRDGVGLAAADPLSRTLPTVAGILAVLIGGLAIAGWLANVPVLTSLSPLWVTMKINTAVAVVLSGTSLLLLTHPTPTRVPLGVLLASCVLVLGGLSLAEYLFAQDFGIDQLLVTDAASSPGTSSPGRMSTVSASSFVLLSTALLVSALAHPVALGHTITAALATSVSMMGALALAGYITDVGLGYQWWNYTGTSVQSATCFVLLGLGTLGWVRRTARTPWALGRGISAGFIGASALIVMTSSSSYHLIDAFADADRRALVSQRRLNELHDLAALDIQAFQRGYFLTGDTAQLTKYDETRRSLQALIDAVLAATTGIPRQHDRAVEVAALAAERVAWTDETIRIFQREGLAATQAKLTEGTGVRLSDRIRLLLADMVRDEQASLQRLQTESAALATTTLLFLPLTAFLSLAILALQFFALNAGYAERRRAEEALRTLNGELEERVGQRTAELETANKELEAFAYSVSHDLRAPLRHVHGYVEMLTRDTAGLLTEKPRRYLKTIADASSEMGDLIDDLLAFSRMGRSEMSATTVDLDRLVEEVIAGMEMTTRDRQIRWTRGPLPRVVGDAQMLRQALANLLDNAVKYTRIREVAEIELGCNGAEHGRSIFFVRDNGVGFDAAYAHKLFGVFQRLHRAEDFEGTGIGLATVQRIIARHGGRTWAESTLDHGATFYFTLRVAPSVSTS
jgi:signal transduction histidine kinase